MHHQMLKSKIHRATTTDCDVDLLGGVSSEQEALL